MLLDATPRKLADAAVHWAAQQLLGENLPDKVGVCRLAWEEETERVLMKWLQDNPKQGSAGLVGGKQKNKNKGLPLHEQAMKAMCYVLMHAAGTEECPISEEGWVKWQQLAAHQSCKRFQNWVLLEALDQDKKDRLVAKQDTDGVWWVAAWSGHTQERVVGPAAVVPTEELPALLAHGSYRRHTASIQKKGLVRGDRDVHFHDPEEHAERWRVDLETRIDIDVKKAVDLGCKFRKTGNKVWLCDSTVPPAAIIRITPWDGLPEGRSLEDREDEHGSAASSAKAPMSSAALPIRPKVTGRWGPMPEEEKKPITEEILYRRRQRPREQLTRELRRWPCCGPRDPRRVSPGKQREKWKLIGGALTLRWKSPRPSQQERLYRTCRT